MVLFIHLNPIENNIASAISEIYVYIAFSYRDITVSKIQEVQHIEK